MKLKHCPVCRMDTAVENTDRLYAWIECDDHLCGVRGPRASLVRREPGSGTDEAIEEAGRYWNEMPRKEEA